MSTAKRINLDIIPRKPGVYFYRDAAGRLLYIGKAKNLHSRVSSYFHHSAELTPAKVLMVGRIAKVEYIITSSEVEALLLESNQIKQHQPPYNIDLKDDKNFMYIKITVGEPFPRIFTVRRISRDGAKYFGPYVSAGAVRQTLHTLRKLFPHRNFTKAPPPNRLRDLVRRYPQLMGPADPKEYRQTIDRIVQFLRGHYTDIVTELTKRMGSASTQRQYERAALYRDKIQAIERIMAKQKVVSTKLDNEDILSVARQGDRAAVNLFSVRNGMLIAKQNFLLTNAADQTDGELLQTFIERYYSSATDIPRQLVTATPLPNAPLLEKTFRCRIAVAVRGHKRQYLQLGQENASHYLEALRASWEHDSGKAQNALKQFQTLLGLSGIPKRIEVYDISNIQGTSAVGSMIVFTDGKPDKRWYRKFKIKTVIGANDPAMMAEMLGRRFRHSLSPIQGGAEGAWPMPDLVILDGGKGQLSVVLKNVAVPSPIVALAKQHEDIHLPGQPNPRRFPPNTDALFLIQRMRDEAHRFAITFYRKRHGQRLQHSSLDDIPGIGPKIKKKLLTTFSSVAQIRETSRLKLAKIVGPALAAAIKENL